MTSTQGTSRVSRLDVLVNNAGTSGMEGQPDEVAARSARMVSSVGEQTTCGPFTTHLEVTVNTTDDDWHRVLAVHVDGTFFCTREALKILGSQGSATIVNMGSIKGTSGGGSAPD